MPVSLNYSGAMMPPVGSTSFLQLCSNIFADPGTAKMGLQFMSKDNLKHYILHYT